MLKPLHYGLIVAVCSLFAAGFGIGAIASGLAMAFSRVGVVRDERSSSRRTHA